MKLKFALLLIVVGIWLNPFWSYAVSELQLDPYHNILSESDIQFLEGVYEKVQNETEAETKERILDEMKEMYSNSEDFQDYLVNDPESANEYMERIIEERFRFENRLRLPFSGLSEIFRTPDYIYEIDHDNLVKQSNYYYCGPASALMAIKGWGGSVSGQSDADKMDTLASEMNTNSASGTMVWRLVRELNKYVSGDFYYEHYLGSGMYLPEFRYVVIDTLSVSQAVILHARTGYLDYYNGLNVGHYIPITAYDAQADMVRLNDPHYDNRYFGRHWVSITQAKEACSAEGRYIIMGPLSLV